MVKTQRACHRPRQAAQATAKTAAQACSAAASADNKHYIVHLHPVWSPMLFAAADLQLKRVLGKGGFGEHPELTTCPSIDSGCV
jgi:hypothetical protein